MTASTIRLLKGLLFAASGLLVGCATVASDQSGGTPADGDDTPTAAEAPDAPVEVEPVYGSFDRETLYNLLVAEFAGRRGQLDVAVDSYLRAARDTGDAGIAERATRIALYARDNPSSLAAAAHWAALASDDAEAVSVHAALLLRDGKVDAAYQQFERLIELDAVEPRRAYARIAEILVREDDRPAALELMQRIAAARPDDLDARFALAELATRTGSTELAIEQLRAIRAAHPDDERSADLLARVLQGAGRTDEALSVLEDYLRGSPDAHGARTSYARLLLVQERYVEARDEFARVSEALPDNADARFAYAIVLLQNQQTAEARTQFEALARSEGRESAAYYYLGQIAEGEEERAAAMRAYRQVDSGEFRFNAQLRLGVLMALDGDLTAARSHLQGMRRVYPGEATRLFRAEADVLTRAEQLGEARGVYDRALEEHPQHTDLLYARAMLAARDDRVADLERDLRDILSREPDNADALNALGYTLADKTDRFEEARDLIERALAIKPDDHYIIDSMGWVLFRLGEYEQALTHLRRALDLQADAEVAAHLGEVLWTMGRRDEARDVWSSALREDPESKPLLDVIRRFGGE